jgi:4-amino-4-deoxy-L-arabinose transferase-like glycosyltransferase
VSWRRALAAIVVVALVARVVIVLATPGFKAVADAGDFDRIAVSLVQHGSFPPSLLTASGGPTAFRPPLFPLALAGVYELTGTGSQATRLEGGRMLEAGLGAVAVLLIALIAARLWSRRVGLLAGGIAAVYPPLWVAGMSLLSESLFIPLVLAAILAALRAREEPHRLRWAVASGALAGLAALTRGNGIVLLIPLALLVWGTPVRSLSSLRTPAALVAATVITLLPWTIRNAEQFHQFVPLTTETGYALAGTYNPVSQSDSQYPALWRVPVSQLVTYYRHDPSADEAQVSDHLTSQALDYIGNHPGSILRTTFWSVARALNLTGTGVEEYLAPFQGYTKGLVVASVYAFWLVLALAAAATLAGAASPMPKALWAWPIVIVLSCAIFEGDSRYRSPSDPFFIMLAAAAVSLAWQRWRAPLRSRLPLAD